MTLAERRRIPRDPSGWTEYPVARFRFHPENGLWLLYCRDRNSRWHRPTVIEPSPLAALLDAVTEDRTGIFWG